MTEILKQGQYQPMPVEEQVVDPLGGRRTATSTTSRSTRCSEFEAQYLDYLRTAHPELLQTDRDRERAAQRRDRSQALRAAVDAVQGAARSFAQPAAAVSGDGSSTTGRCPSPEQRRAASLPARSDRWPAHARSGAASAASRNMSQITRAMEMVAAAKMRKAQQRVTASRPYSEQLRADDRRPGLAAARPPSSWRSSRCSQQRPVQNVELIVWSRRTGV